MLWFWRTSRIAGQQIVCILENYTQQCTPSGLKNKRSLYGQPMFTEWFESIKSVFMTCNRIAPLCKEKSLFILLFITQSMRKGEKKL